MSFISSSSAPRHRSAFVNRPIRSGANDKPESRRHHEPAQPPVEDAGVSVSLPAPPRRTHEIESSQGPFGASGPATVPEPTRRTHEMEISQRSFGASVPVSPAEPGRRTHEMESSQRSFGTSELTRQSPSEPSRLESPSTFPMPRFLANLKKPSPNQRGHIPEPNSATNETNTEDRGLYRKERSGSSMRLQETSREENISSSTTEIPRMKSTRSAVATTSVLPEIQVGQSFTVGNPLPFSSNVSLVHPEQCHREGNGQTSERDTAPVEETKESHNKAFRFLKRGLPNIGLDTQISGRLSAEDTQPSLNSSVPHGPRPQDIDPKSSNGDILSVEEPKESHKKAFRFFKMGFPGIGSESIVGESVEDLSIRSRKASPQRHEEIDPQSSDGRETVLMEETKESQNKALRFLRKGFGSIPRRSNTDYASEAHTSWRSSVKTVVSTWIAKKIDVNDLDSNDIVIAVMGPTGAGKSSFINMVVKADEDDTEASVQVGHSLASCTSEVAMVELSDPNSSSRIVFVDTPGFDDTTQPDTEILRMIADWLETTYKKEIKLAGIIYLHRISDNRMAGTPLKNLEMFEKLCGKHALRNVVLATTMWDEVEEPVGNQREVELQQKYWRGMIHGGSKTFRYTRTQDSAWTITEHFLPPYVSYALQLQQAKIALERRKPRVTVQLQHELVDDRTPLPETKAGQTLFARLEAMISRQQDTLKRLQKEQSQYSDEQIQRLLQTEFESQRQELQKMLKEAETLRIPLTRRMIRIFTSPLRRSY